MLVTISEQQGTVWVHIDQSQLNYANAYALKDTFLELIRAEHRVIVVDMSQVTTMDSKGLSTFLFAHRALGAEGQLVLTELQPAVQRIFALTRVDQLLRIYAHREQVPA